MLVRDQAAPKNSWSNTLYSEDGKYTFTKTESGRWQMHLIDDAAVGASLEDIANWMMSGTPNRNIETRYLNYLHTVDPDLYNVAMRIGSEVRTYGFMEDLHQQGILQYKCSSSTCFFFYFTLTFFFSGIININTSELARSIIG